MNRTQAREKAAKLMRLAGNHAASEQEAATALRQAQALMREHAIQAAALDTGAGTFDWDEAMVAPQPGRATRRPIRWLGIIALGVSRFTDTRSTWYRNGDGMQLIFRGEAADVAWAVWLTGYLRDTIRRASAAWTGTRREREDFRMGMVTRLRQRMRELHADRYQDSTASTALVWVDRKQAALDDRFGPQSTQPGRTVQRQARALQAGRDTAERVTFHRPVNRQHAALD